MNGKELVYKIEEEFLLPHAFRSNMTKGRVVPIAECPLRTEFCRDRDRIIHCKSFRRLKHKTQVFLSPEKDHYRTRLTHTLEVTQIARTIARALRLNEDLTEAIALGHDLGHTPFGHAGERALNCFYPFEHNAHSLRIVEVLEYDGKGMNLTFEVRDGILNHTSKGNPCTVEGQVVQWSDRIAYINHDIDDAVRAGVIKSEDIPSEYVRAFGTKSGLRVNSMVADMVENSYGKPFARPSEAFIGKIGGLRQFMFDRVYSNKPEEHKAVDMLKFLYEYFLKNLHLLPAYIKNLDCANEQKVCDYIASMTDRFAVAVYESICIPKSWGGDLR